MRNTYRKILAVLLSICFVFSAMVFATAEDSEIKVTPDGQFQYKTYTEVDEWGADETPVTWSNIIEIVKYIGTSPVVEIPDTIPGLANFSVKVIGIEAFSGYYETEADENGTTKTPVTAVTNVTIPDSVEIIDDRAFQNCTTLTNIIMPDSVTVIGNYAFSGCSGLTAVGLPANVVTIGDGAFQNCVNLTGNGSYTSNTTGEDVVSLIIPSSVKTLGASAFEGCTSIIVAVLNEGLEKIQAGAFADCTNLERVEIPSTVTYIGAAFNGAFTIHNNKCDEPPVLKILAPHAEIVESPNIDVHVVIYGVEHSSVHSFVDEINANRKANTPGTNGGIIDSNSEYDEQVFIPIEVEGHVFEPVVTAPKCLDKGYTTYTCSCGNYNDQHYVGDYTDALGHDYTDWTVDVPETCTTVGTKHKNCKRCDTSYAADSIVYVSIPATGHDMKYFNSVSCTENGSSYNKCANCGLTENWKIVYAPGHTFNYEKPSTTTQKWVECSQDGIYTFNCVVCGYEKKAIKNAHTDADNDFICDVCEQNIGSSDKTEDGTCSCSCHSQVGFKAFFYKIKLFFWKIFGTNKTCDCGVMHY